MLTGPVFQVELLTLARRKRYYLLRFLYGLLLLYLIGSTLFFSDREQSEFTIQELASIGSWIFWIFGWTQFLLLLILTPAIAAGVVADERQRKTLGDLLTTQLTSAEIVLGKLAARMLTVVVLLAVGLPILSLTSFFGGVDPNLVVLLFAASLSTTFFLSALAVVISVHARRPREALMVTYLAELAWLFGPSIVLGLLSYNNLSWVVYTSELIATISPFHVLMIFLSRGGSMTQIHETVAWMIGLQVSFAVAFAALAVVRLRPVHRSEGVKAGSGKTRRRSWRLWPRRPCGDDPILWKELSVARGSRMARSIGLLVFVGLGGLLAYITYIFAVPAITSIWITGFFNAAYQSTSQSELNGYLRFVLTLVSFVWLIGTAGAASSGLTGEREGDTWLSLIATPLTPLEIVRGKMLGAIWALRNVGFVWLALMMTGVLLGAIHPIGFLICGVFNLVDLWFATALGTAFSLRSRNSSRALLATMATLLFCNGVYLIVFLPMGFDASPLPFMGVTPFINAVTVLDYPEVSRFLYGNYGQKSANEINLVCTTLLSLFVYSTAAIGITAYLILNFDDAIDRPRTVNGRRPKRSGPTPLMEKDFVTEDV